MKDAASDPSTLASEVDRKRRADRLFSDAYDELAKVAHAQRRRWTGDHTLNTTAIVHEAYLRLIERQTPRFDNSGHFRCVLAKAMRHLLVDYSRRRLADRRGGNRRRETLTNLQVEARDRFTLTEDTAADVLQLHEALEKLARTNPRQALVVECRFFAGFTIDETAGVMNMSPATVKREWSEAQRTLYSILRPLE